MEGQSPIVFAPLKKCKQEKGFIEEMYGTQTRDCTHVQDIVIGNICLMNKTSVCGVVDLCTGTNATLNEVVTYFNLLYGIYRSKTL